MRLISDAIFNETKKVLGTLFEITKYRSFSVWFSKTEWICNSWPPKFV